MKILVTPTSFGPSVHGIAKDRLLAFTDEVVYNETGAPLEEDVLASLLVGCDGLLAGLDHIGPKALKAASGTLRAISRYGVGTDKVDLTTARALGIPVSITPGANANAVADLAFGLMLAVARRIPQLDASTKVGGWERSTGTEVYGKTLGILGLGAIGKGVAHRAKGFDMDVLAYDPFLSGEVAAQHRAHLVTLDQVLAQSDIITLHLPLNDDTRQVIGAAELAAMKPGAILINTSRGGLIDEDAVLAALQSGRLGGLGVDAFVQEPPKNNPLLRLDNVVATPHTGAHTYETTESMAKAAVDNLISMLTGRQCASIVN